MPSTYTSRGQPAKGFAIKKLDFKPIELLKSPRQARPSAMIQSARGLPGKTVAQKTTISSPPAETIKSPSRKVRPSYMAPTKAQILVSEEKNKTKEEL